MDGQRLVGKNILLVVSGGIAAYKCPQLIRDLRREGASVRCVLSRNAHHFVTALTLAAVSEAPVCEDVFSLTDDHEMGHIQLPRTADLVVVAPASADLLAKMAVGLADDAASTLLLAAGGPILFAPAMNTHMWHHPATQANIATLRERGLHQIGPDAGDLACGDVGPGRMVDPEAIVAAAVSILSTTRPLAGRRALVTAGPTREPIDPVRYLGNRSSGKQGFAIAAGLNELGAETFLVSGPTSEPPPPGVHVTAVETAVEMAAAVDRVLPVDVAVCTAAVADWRVAEPAADKIHKSGDGPPTLTLVENPDILATISRAGERRPCLVVGFAAETDEVVANASAKRMRKGCDWIVANDVGDGSDTFGGTDNAVHVITGDGAESWPRMSKVEIGRRLARRIADALVVGGDRNR